MADNTELVAVHLPADLWAKIEDLKQFREADRGKTVDEIVQEMCRSYVRARELARQEHLRKDEIEASYKERPSDWDDAEEWTGFYSEDQDAKP